MIRVLVDSTSERLPLAMFDLRLFEALGPRESALSNFCRGT